MNVSSPSDYPAAYQHPCAWDTLIKSVSLPQMFARSVAAGPSSPLVEFLGRTYTYRELFEEAQRFAAGLQQAGITKGERVGLFLPNVPIYLSAYYGAMMAGAVVVNFSPLYSAEELGAQVEDSGARLLVTVDNAALLPTALQVLDESSLDHLVVGRTGDMLPAGKRIALKLFGRKQTAAIPARADVIIWPEYLGSSEPAPVVIDPDQDLALLQYTGGTTGTPKGAMLTHANLSANAAQVQAIDPFEGADIILGVLPLFHVFANTCVLNRTVAKGGCIVMLPRFDAGQVLKTLKRVKPTSFPGVPTMYQALLDHPQIDRADFSSLKICISGGAPLPGPLRDKFEQVSGVRLVEGYGLTESSGVVTANPYAGLRKPGTIGQVLPQTRIRLRDKEDVSLPAGAGEPGELIVRGPQIMRGYWNRPDAARTAFVTIDGEPWLRTGDIAAVDADGFIAIVDRSKDMIAVGGFKVFPSRVEAVLVENPAVKEALVIGVPDEYLGELPMGYVTLESGIDQSGEGGAEHMGETLTNWLNTKVGKHERVKGIVVRDELPKTMIGKLDRKALRAQVLD